MRSFKLVYKAAAAKDIKKLPPQVRKRLKLKLEWFASQSDPISFAQPLTKPVDAQYRFRVGNYRILFDVDNKNIVILHVQHRRDIYRK